MLEHLRCMDIIMLAKVEETQVVIGWSQMWRELQHCDVSVDRRVDVSPCLRRLRLCVKMLNLRRNFAFIRLSERRPRIPAE